MNKNKNKNTNTSIPNISYKINKGVFVFDQTKLYSTIDDDINIFVKKYEKNKKFFKSYKQINIKDLKFHDYDNCMLDYCFSVLDKKIPEHETKWIKKYSNLICLGLVEKEIYYDNKKILSFFEQKKFNHIKNDLIFEFTNNKRKNFSYKNKWLFFIKNEKFNIKKKFKFLLNNFLSNNNFYRVVPIINLIK